MKCPVFFIRIIAICQLATFHIATLNQILIDCIRQIFRYLDFISIRVGKNTIHKQFDIHLFGAIFERIGQTILQRLREFCKT